MNYRVMMYGVLCDVVFVCLLFVFVWFVCGCWGDVVCHVYMCVMCGFVCVVCCC